MDQYRPDCGFEFFCNYGLYSAYCDEGKGAKIYPDLTGLDVVAGLKNGPDVGSNSAGIEKVRKNQDGPGCQDQNKPRTVSSPQGYFSGFAHKLSKSEKRLTKVGTTLWSKYGQELSKSKSLGQVAISLKLKFYLPVNDDVQGAVSEEGVQMV